MLLYTKEYYKSYACIMFSTFSMMANTEVFYYMQHVKNYHIIP